MDSLGLVQRLPYPRYHDVVRRTLTSTVLSIDTGRWSKLLRSERGDPTPDLFTPRDDFTFILVTGEDEPLPAELLVRMTVVRVLGAEQASGIDKETHEDQELAGLFGASEVKRNSLAMVEAAFDGCV